MYNLMQFDGSFRGFLSLLYFIKNKNITPTNIISLDASLSLFDTPFYVKTDIEASIEFFNFLKRSMPKFALKNFYYAFLYDNEPIYLHLHKHCTIDPKFLHDSATEPVKSVEKYAKFVLKERHKMLGFVRFSKLENEIFYAKIEPKSNILALLGTHFKKRFSHEWIIHDTKRELALTHKDGFLDIKSVQSYTKPTLNKEESACKELWKEFFTSINIKERKNSALQRQHVPLFYREFMDEFSER